MCLKHDIQVTDATTLSAHVSRVPKVCRQRVFTVSRANQPISRNCMTKKVHRSDSRRSRDLGAKFWISLATGSSIQGPLAYMPITCIRVTDLTAL